MLDPFGRLLVAPEIRGPDGGGALELHVGVVAKVSRTDLEA